MPPARRCCWVSIGAIAAGGLVRLKLQAGQGAGQKGEMTTPAKPFRYFHSSPEVIRLVVMMCVRFPLSLRNVEDLLFERGVDICHETERFWWNRFGPMFASEIRRKRVSQMRGFRHWRWHVDAVFVSRRVA